MEKNFFFIYRPSAYFNSLALIVLRGDPSLVVRARIRLPASPCLHHICCFRYSTTFIHASHPLIRSIHLCTTLTYALHSFFSFYISAIYMLHLFMHHYLCYTYLYIIVIHILHLFIYYTYYLLLIFICCTHLYILFIYVSHLFIYYNYLFIILILYITFI